MNYSELHALSHYSFLRGASSPDELVERAAELGYAGLALTDECSVAGAPKAHVAARSLGLPLLIGSEFAVHATAQDLAPSFKLILLAQNLNGYGNLCQFITRLRRASGEKGSYRLDWHGLDPALLSDCLWLLVPDRAADDDALLAQARWLLQHVPGRAWIAVELLREVSDECWLQRLRHLSATTALPLVAAGDVHMHRRSRKALQDVMTATRLNRPLAECGLALQANAERHLRSRLRLAQLYPPDLLAQTQVVASLCRFSLDEIRYQYPSEVVPEGRTPREHLRALTYEGMHRRWPGGVKPVHRDRIEHELALIEELGYEHYFLTVADIVRFARGEKILCQGRGSAANSVVCYCLHITSVDPDRSTLLFERFISRERNEPPDIDVDFEHERREEVIQYLYNRYGRDRAALTAVLICYRPRSAIRDVGKALGLDEALVDRIARDQSHWTNAIPEDHLQALCLELGLPRNDLRLRQLIALSLQLMGMPRHLSQHPGGFVLTQEPLERLVPIENAAMPERSVVQWDKDDLDAMGLLKVDVLALGMLTAIRRCFDLVNALRHLEGDRQLDLAAIPEGDTATYEMICKADTVGTFQIESRAQMSMLPRLQPRHFYDLVIEVAIVRPGPIEGGMVHPYLENRAKPPDQIDYPPRLKAALERTCGVPIFQEQVMQIAMIAAGFSAGEADQLRRAMAAWKRPGVLEQYYDKVVSGMRANGYADDFAERIFKQIKGFSSYGFPESHAASFALLTYVSCWLKCHEPAAFLCALLNAQPLGFYSASQLVQDARRHGVEVRPIDVSASAALSTLEPRQGERQPAVRLGLLRVSGLATKAAERIEAARRDGPFTHPQDLAQRAGLDGREMQLLAAADALKSLAGQRRQQVWQASALKPLPPLLQGSLAPDTQLELPIAPEGEEIVWDYAATGLTLRRHPLALLRPRLADIGLKNSAQLAKVPNGRRVSTCGIVTVRQKPQTAKGTLFISLEDEAGSIQVIVWPQVYAEHRRTILRARLLAVHGRWQRTGGVCNLIAQGFDDHSAWLGRCLSEKVESRDFR